LQTNTHTHTGLSAGENYNSKLVADMSQSGRATMSTAKVRAVTLERDDFSSKRHPAAALCLRMFFFAKPVPIFAGHALGLAIMPIHTRGGSPILILTFSIDLQLKQSATVWRSICASL
jgi:hypothetical protein